MDVQKKRQYSDAFGGRPVLLWWGYCSFRGVGVAQVVPLQARSLPARRLKHWL